MEHNLESWIKRPVSEFAQNLLTVKIYTSKNYHLDSRVGGSPFKCQVEPVISMPSQGNMHDIFISSKMKNDRNKL